MKQFHRPVSLSRMDVQFTGYFYDVLRILISQLIHQVLCSDYLPVDIVTGITMRSFIKHLPHLCKINHLMRHMMILQQCSYFLSFC